LHSGSDQRSARSAPATWAGPERDVLGFDKLAAPLAGNDRDALVIVVMELDWRAARRCSPSVAPFSQCHQYTDQVMTGGGEDVLDAGGVFRVRPPFDDAVSDQGCETRGEKVATDTEILDEFVEPTHANREVTQDQRRPPITDRFQRPGKRAVEGLEARLSHAPILSVVGLGVALLNSIA
jgi:hypothetical protein